MRNRPFLAMLVMAAAFSACRTSPTESTFEGSPAPSNLAGPTAGFELHVQESTPAAASTSPADEEAELAKKLSNPIASLISVPIQYNWDTGIGPADADRTTINVQPVVPFEINPEWNLITRTIVPIIDAESPVSGGSDESGLGDVTESLFFSPKKPTESGWIWGAGPVLLIPTASEDALGTGKVAAGPTAVVLKQENGWTYGALANHLWSFAGDDDRTYVNSTFLQPFFAYTTKTHTTFTVNTESTYDWNGDDWTVPINIIASQVLKVGGLPISLGIGYREYVEVPDGGPDWGLRFVLTFLFPR